MTRLRSFGLALLFTSGFMLASPLFSELGSGVGFIGKAQAQNYQYMSCGELWYARNAIYASRGYCFKTRRARNAFGARCYAPWGRLTASQQRRVNRIVSWERRMGCR
ncbi:YARHG domain-containing protein [Cohaesibacter celericrescens]|nr:YARHG domain-containing protein [Cohaesibacter celericrescens]